VGLEEYLKSRRYREEWQKARGYADELPRLMESDSCDVRKKVVYAMGKLAQEGYDFIPCLIAALNDECEWVRGNAAEALGELGVAEETIIDLLEDGCPFVRHKAAEAIGKIGEKNTEFARKAYKALLKRLNDRSSYVQYVALEALRKLNLPEDIEKDIIGILGSAPASSSHQR